MTTASGSFELRGWEEASYEDRGDGARLARAHVTQAFSGDVAGDGVAEWLLSYRPDGTAHFVGLQHITGEVAGRRGSVVLETTGEFDGQLARWDASVVAGSGTEALAGLRGRGSFEAPHGSRATFTLDYEIG